LRHNKQNGLFVPLFLNDIYLKLSTVFFLGLLSTPMPYLLLAAFYFFGFAMGMFNNSTGEESTLATASVSIPAEVKQKVVDHSAYYYQVNQNAQHQGAAKISKTENSQLLYAPDTGIIVHLSKDKNDYQFLLSEFRFSRPPPSFC